MRLSALVALLLLVPTGAQAAVRDSACARASGRTVVQNGSYRVFQRIKLQPKKYFTSLTSVYSCPLTKVHLKKTLIAKWGNNLDGTQIVIDGHLAGTFALLRVESETGVTDELGLIASDMRKGGGWQFFPPEERLLGESWIASGGGVLAVVSPGADSATLHAFDSTGDHTLATGAFTEPGVSAQHAYWYDQLGLHSYAFTGAVTASK